MNADLRAKCVRRTPHCFQRCWFFVVYVCVVLTYKDSDVRPAIVNAV